jgi:hypothetical protein
MKARAGRHTKDEAVLISMAESIGSTLGSIAAKADAAQKALSPSHIAETVQREGKKLVRKSKTIALRTRNKAAANLRTNKVTKVARRGARQAASSAKQVGRRGRTRTRGAARRARAKR